MRKPAIKGPAKAPSPSPVVQAVFAATSSVELRAKAGMRVACVGRTGAPAAAATAATTKNIGVEPPVAMTRAQAAALAVRRMATLSRIRSPRKRARSAPLSMPETTPGTIRTAPRRAVATTPSRA